MAAERVTVVLIGAADRSGSTILDCLLGQSPGFFSGGEVIRFWERLTTEDALCGCGARFRACPLWAAVIEEAFGGPDQIDARAVASLGKSILRVRNIPRLALGRRGRDGVLETYCAMLSRLYGAISAVSGCPVVVDSSKDPIYAFPLLATSNVELRLIHLVRDSRAVAHSVMRHRRRPHPAGKDVWMRTMSPMQSSMHWNLRNALLHSWRLWGLKAMKVRYEDLATNPRETLRSIFARLTAGAGPLELPNDHSAHMKETHTVYGNPVRFRVGQVEIRPDLEWRTALPCRDRRQVTALTWPGLVSYGYLTRKLAGPGARSAPGRGQRA